MVVGIIISVYVHGFKEGSSMSICFLLVLLLADLSVGLLGLVASRCCRLLFIVGGRQTIVSFG